MLRTTRILLVAVLLIAAVVYFNGCYTVVTQSNVRQTYPHSRLVPSGEYEDAEEYVEELEYDEYYDEVKEEWFEEFNEEEDDG